MPEEHKRKLSSGWQEDPDLPGVYFLSREKVDLLIENLTKEQRKRVEDFASRLREKLDLVTKK